MRSHRFDTAAVNHKTKEVATQTGNDDDKLLTITKVLLHCCMQLLLLVVVAGLLWLIFVWCTAGKTSQ